MMHVTLVSGPAGCGKTSWVKANRAPGSVVLDYDALAVALGSDVDPATRDRDGDSWDQHGELVAGLARSVRAQLLRQLLATDAPAGRLYVTATRPHPALTHRANVHIELPQRVAP